jgi:hypothetical protein
MDTRRLDIPADVLASAHARAREDGTTLDAVLTWYLGFYACHGSMQSSGGHARKLSMSAKERSDAARKAAAARWKEHAPDGS